MTKRCLKGKPCGNVCIPKKATCNSGAKNKPKTKEEQALYETQERLKRAYGITATGVAVGGFLAGSAALGGMAYHAQHPPIYVDQEELKKAKEGERRRKDSMKTRKDFFKEGFDKKTAFKCISGKPCKGVCIPRNKKCSDKEVKQQHGRNLQMGAAIAGTGLLAAGLAYAAADVGRITDEARQQKMHEQWKEAERERDKSWQASRREGEQQRHERRKAWEEAERKSQQAQAGENEEQRRQRRERQKSWEEVNREWEETKRKSQETRSEEAKNAREEATGKKESGPDFDPQWGSPEEQARQRARDEAKKQRGKGKKTPSGREWHEVLGVSPNASKSQVKKAMGELKKKYHPDLNKDPGAKEKYHDVSEAYDIWNSYHRTDSLAYKIAFYEVLKYKKYAA